MKKLILDIIIGLSFFYSFSQTNGDIKYQFSEEVFSSKHYQKSEYERFSGRVEAIKQNTYKFGDKTLIILGNNIELRKLFEEGIFNPDVIFGKHTIKKTKAEITALSTNEKVFFNLSRNDSLTISNFESLEKLNPNNQTKRYKFWVWRLGTANPTEYYIELFNDKATKETDWDEFIAKSKLSFFYIGTLII